MTTGQDAWNCREGLKNGRGAVFEIIPRLDDNKWGEDWIVLLFSPAALADLSVDAEDIAANAKKEREAKTASPERRYPLYFSVKASHPRTETPAGAHGPFSVGYTTYHSSLLTPSLEDEPGSRFHGSASSDLPHCVEHAESRLAEAVKIIGKLLASAVPNKTEHPTMFAAHEEAEEFVRLVRSEYGAE
jgi:hypothetical protein